MRIIDLSAQIAQTPEDTPEYSAVGIAYHTHAEGAAAVENLLNVPRALMRQAEGWATETITRLETHGTTHVDAPWHYNSIIQGQKAETIDELPLEWFFGDGVKLDFHIKEERDSITVEDMENELQRIGYTLKPMDIVLMFTGRDVFINQGDYFFKGCGVTAAATIWLYEKGIRVMGIDAWGWDRSLHLQAQEAIAEDKPVLSGRPTRSMPPIPIWNGWSISIPCPLWDSRWPAFRSRLRAPAHPQHESWPFYRNR